MKNAAASGASLSATAVGEGAMAVQLVHDHVAAIGQRIDQPVRDEAVEHANDTGYGLAAGIVAIASGTLL